MRIPISIVVNVFCVRVCMCFIKLILISTYDIKHAVRISEIGNRNRKTEFDQIKHKNTILVLMLYTPGFRDCVFQKIFKIY